MNMRRSLVSRSNTAKLRQRYKTHKEYDRLMSVDLDAILDTVSTTFSIPPFQILFQLMVYWRFLFHFIYSWNSKKQRFSLQRRYQRQ